MTQPLIIIGAGGHGREVLDVVDAINAVQPTFTVVGFLDDGEPDIDLIKGRGHGLLEPAAAFADRPDAAYVIAIGASDVRKRVDESHLHLGRECPVLIHPDSTIGPDVELGPGTIVTAGVRLGNHIRVGRHVHLNMNSTVHHDTVLEDYVTLSPGVHVNGNATIREAAFLGTAATVIQGREVGAGATIGAGAVVVRDIPAGVTAMGVPARVTHH